MQVRLLGPVMAEELLEKYTESEHSVQKQHG